MTQEEDELLKRIVEIACETEQGKQNLIKVLNEMLAELNKPND